MEIEVRYLGYGKGCHGWTTAREHPLPAGVPEGKWVKVLKADNGRGWLPWTTLTVVTRQGEKWDIRKECLEQDCVFTLDGGKTTLERKDPRVRKALMDLYCREEADLEESQKRVEITGQLLRRSGGDPEARRRKIEEIRQDLKKPCKTHKPGSARDYWDSRQASLKKELRRLLNGGVP